MQIKTAEFIVSNQEVFKCPNNQIPEYAFIGRSNVGKSSLINMLTNQKRLAKTSSSNNCFSKLKPFIQKHQIQHHLVMCNLILRLGKPN